MQLILLLWALLTTAVAQPSMRSAPDDIVPLTPNHAVQIPADWVTTPGPIVNVHTAPDDDGLALRLSRHAAQRVPELSKALGVPIGGPIDVYVAPSEQLFDSLQPGSIPDWADGTAWPQYGLIFLRSPSIRPGTSNPLEQVFEHELIHVLLGRAFAPQPTPRWLQEGVAQVFAGEYSERHARALEKGLFGGDLIRLDELASGFPSDPIRAQLAYAQSADLIVYIRGTFGPDALPTLISEMTRGTRFGHAVRAATGVGPSQLDEMWRADVGSSPQWVQALASDTVFFGIGAVLMIVGGVMVRRRNRKKLERWSREEALQEALRMTLERQATKQVEAPRTWLQLPEDSQWIH